MPESRTQQVEILDFTEQAHTNTERDYESFLVPLKKRNCWNFPAVFFFLST